MFTENKTSEGGYEFSSSRGYDRPMAGGADMSDSGQELGARQARLVGLLASGLTTGQAAAQLNVTERQARRWRALPAVRSALDGLTRDAMQGASSRLSDLLSAAAEALGGIVRDPTCPPGARISAARVIIEGAIRLRETNDLDERLSVIEARLRERAGGSHGI